MLRTTTRTSYLDGIRGVAAFLVFFHHFLLAFYPAYFTLDKNAVHLPHGLEISFGLSPFSILANGHFYVCIFFVLSGFVLSHKYFHTHSLNVLISGAQRRFLRLYIPVAFTLILSFILLRAFLYYNVPVRTIAHSEWWFGPFIDYRASIAAFYRCLAYATMFQGDNTFDTSMWTMAVELYGSLFVFAFLALTNNTKNRGAMLCFTLVYCLLTDSENLGAFVLGISLNYFAKNHVANRARYSAWLSLLSFAIALGFGSFPYGHDVAGTFYAHLPLGLLAWSRWYHILGGYFLVLSFVISPVLQRIISRRLFRFFGHISFSLYLLHPLVLSSFSSFLFLQLYSSLGYNKSVTIVFVSTIGVCVGVSWLMARYIDAPGVKFAAYVYKRFVKAGDEREQALAS